MCGIIYYKSFTGKPVNRLVLKHYFGQKHRGHEGFGFMGISGKRLMVCRTTQERGIKHYLKRHPFSEILFHHRYPTSTRNTIKTTHPIVVSQPLYSHKYYVIHNGMIYNAQELKEKHEGMKIDYTTSQCRSSFGQQFVFSPVGQRFVYSPVGRRNDSRNLWGKIGEGYEFNDSEALAHEVALFLEGKQNEIEAQGDMAFICLETDRHNNALKLHFGRNDYAPLEMRKDAEYLVIASEGVSRYSISSHNLHTYDYRTREISQRTMELPEFGFSSDGFSLYQGEMDDIEMEIEEHEERLKSIDLKQSTAHIRGNITEYQQLQDEKEWIEEEIQKLSEEWYRLERMCFD